MIKRGESVLEPACGPASLADYLPKGVRYFGFDLNEEFIKYAKNKNRNVVIGDVLDKKNYKKSEYVIAVDILHHLPDEVKKKFLEYSFESCEKAFIICEPTEKQNKDSIFFPVKKFFIEWFERDGQNDMSVDSGFEPEAYNKWIKEGFGVIPNSAKRVVEKMGTDTIVTFYKNT